MRRLAMWAACSIAAMGVLAAAPGARAEILYFVDSAGKAVMEPFLDSGGVIREYAPVEIGALNDLGYDAVSGEFLEAPHGSWDEAKAVHETVPGLVLVFEASSLPTTGIVGLCIVAVACILAGAFIILRRGG